MNQRTTTGRITNLTPQRLGLLDRAVREATSDGGRLLIVGEPGIGKSFIIDEIVSSATTGRTLLLCRASDHDGRPYSALSALFSSIPERSFRHLSTAQRDSVLSAIGRRRVHAMDAVVLQTAVTRVLAGIARTGATVVVDDWHEIDKASRQLLEHSIRSSTVAGLVAAIATQRADGMPDDRAAGPTFAARDVVVVPPLSPIAIRSILVDAGLGDVSASDSLEVAALSEGNPQWAIELLAARVDGAHRRLVATTVTDAMTERVVALSAPVRKVLEVVAISNGLRASHLRAVVAGADQAVADGVGQHVLRLDDDVVLAAHPLLAGVVSQSLPPEDRRRIHAAVAQLPLPPEQRLRHRDAATPPGSDDVLAEELMTAAMEARRTGTADVARRFAQRAVARTSDESKAREDRVLLAAEMAFAAGYSALAWEILGELKAERLSIEMFDRGVSMIVRSTRRIGGRTAVSRRLAAHQRIATVGSAQWKVLQVYLLTSSASRPDDLDRQLGRLVETLSLDDTPLTISHALYRMARARLDLGGGVDDELAQRMREAEARMASPTLEQTADAIEALWPYQADDLSRSRANLTSYVRAAKLAHEHYAVVQGLSHAAIVETLAGRFSRATALIREAESETGKFVHLPPSHVRARGLLAVSTHDTETLGAILTEDLSPASEQRAALVLAGLAGLDAAYSGRWDDAVLDLDRAYRAARGRGVVEPGRRLWVDVELARACIALGETDRAQEVISDLAVLGRAPARAHVRGQELRLRGRGALVALDRGGFVPELARAQLEHISMLRAAGDMPRARAVLSSTEGVALRMGEPRIIEQVEELRRQLDGVDGRSAMTRAELRTARAAAAGKSNREIADDQVISVRTVETHLSSVYRKLGLRTRTQLALVLNDTGRRDSA
jgi:DNA-binding CsgD family transcriptional regulator